MCLIRKKFACKTCTELALEFLATHWQCRANVPPVLKDAAVNLFGNVERSVEVSSHTVFFVIIDSAATYDKRCVMRPAVYFDRDFRTLRDVGES